MENNDNSLREKLANLCHRQWAGWMDYLFCKSFYDVGQFDKDNGNVIIPRKYVARWKRQMTTPYEDLSEEEKESDRKEADKFIELLERENESLRNKVEQQDKEIQHLREWTRRMAKRGLDLEDEE